MTDIHVKRVFVGGLFNEITDKELVDKFDGFGTVDGIEIKHKRSADGQVEKTFAYINLKTSEANLQKCFSIFNKSKWKGSQLCLQQAKEDFIQRLKKERENGFKIEGTRKMKEKNTVHNVLENAPGVENYTMKGASPGTPVPGAKNWVVGKHGYVEPVVYLRRKDRRKVMKVDPSQFLINHKNVAASDDIADTDTITWEMDEKNTDIVKKQKGEFPEWHPKQKNRKLSEHDDTLNRSKNDDFEIVKETRTWDAHHSGPPMESDSDSDYSSMKQKLLPAVGGSSVVQQVKNSNLSVTDSVKKRSNTEKEKRGGNPENVKKGNNPVFDTAESVMNSVKRGDCDNLKAEKQFIKKVEVKQGVLSWDFMKTGGDKVKRGFVSEDNDRSECESVSSADTDEIIRKTRHKAGNIQPPLSDQVKPISLDEYSSGIVNGDVLSNGLSDSQYDYDDDDDSLDEDNYENLARKIENEYRTKHKNDSKVQLKKDKSEFNTSESRSVGQQVIKEKSKGKVNTKDQIRRRTNSENEAENKTSLVSSKKDSISDVGMMDSRSESDSDRDSEQDSESNSEQDSESDSERDSESDSERDSEQDSESNSEQDSESDSERDSEQDSESNSEQDSESDSERDSESDSESNSEQDSDSDTLSHKDGQGKENVTRDPNHVKNGQQKTDLGLPTDSSDTPTDIKVTKAKRGSISIRNIPVFKGTKDLYASDLTTERKTCQSTMATENKMSDKTKDNKGVNPVAMTKMVGSPVLLRDKDQLREESNLKRLESIKLRKMETQGQKSVIKEALSSVDKSSTPNKRIVFDSDSDDDESDDKSSTDPSSSSVSDSSSSDSDDQDEKESKKPALFESSSDDDKEDDSNDDDSKSDDESMFRIRPQFEGKAGQKLIQLQSRYKNDDRFKLDERFQDDDDEEEGEMNDQDVSVNSPADEDERLRSLKILKEVVGNKAAIRVEKDTKNKKIFKDMSALHFDPSREDHIQFEIQTPKENDKDNSEKKNKKKKKQKIEDRKEMEEEEELPEVSKERFYEVTSSFKDTFSDQHKSEDISTESFSLLKAFGHGTDTGEGESDVDEAEQAEKLIPSKEGEFLWQQPFKYDSSDSDDEREEMETDQLSESGKPAQSVVVFGTTPTSFFFCESDERIQDGVQAFHRQNDVSVIREIWLKGRQQLVDNYRTKHKRLVRKKRQTDKFRHQYQK